jgi:hypothetical protein
VPVWHRVKLTVVEILVDGVDDSLSLLVAGLAPVAQVVEIFGLVLHEGSVLLEVGVD